MTNLADPGIQQALVERLQKLRPTDPARWGKMSAHQTVCHLSDSFRGTMGERHISPATGIFQRTVMKWFALYVPLAWPKGVPTRPEVEQGVGGTPPAEFQRDRADLIRLIERFCEAGRSLDDNAHPIFGKMSRSEWLRWGYLHMDHHLRQFGA